MESSWESELQRACAFIAAEPQYARIALQFPDALLTAAPKITYQVQAAVQGRPDSRVFILGDTAYSPCCVDEVAAEHLAADLVLHFGPIACLTATSRLPVYHVFGSNPIDQVTVAAEISSRLAEHGEAAPVLLLCELEYMHCAEQLSQLMRPQVPGLITARVDVSFVPPVAAAAANSDDGSTAAPAEGTAAEGTAAEGTAAEGTAAEGTAAESSKTTECTVTGWKFDLGGRPIGEWNVVFVGSDSAAATNFILTQHAKAFWRWDVNASSWSLQTPDTHQVLMKRYHMIERAKRVTFFGILVGTLGAGQYMQIIERLKLLIKACGRKSKLILVGKLNVAKLANFAEVGAFVLVGCPLSTLVDSKEYTVPIITPFELEVALGGGGVCWDGKYETDFTNLLAAELGSQPIAAAEVPVSSVSNKRGLLELGAETTSMGASDGVLMLASAAAGGLLSRSFQGLLVGLQGQTAAAIERGQYGIAKGYSTEESNPFGQEALELGSCSESPEAECVVQSAQDAHADAAVEQSDTVEKSDAVEQSAATDESLSSQRARAQRPSEVKPVRKTVESSSDSSSDCEMSLDAFAELEDCLDNL